MQGEPSLTAPLMLDDAHGPTTVRLATTMSAGNLAPCWRPAGGLRQPRKSGKQRAGRLDWLMCCDNPWRLSTASCCRPTPITEKPMPENTTLAGEQQDEACTAPVGLRRIDRASAQRLTAIRFGAARKLAGYDHKQAAGALGYQDSSALLRIEAGTVGAPVHVIQRAAILYGVSMDYLTGLSDHPERDEAVIEQLAIMRCIRETMASAIMDGTARFKSKIGDAPALMAHVATLRDGIGNVFRLLCREPDLLHKHPELKRALDKAVDAADDANAYLRRREGVKANEWLEHVEREFPVLRLVEGGAAGMIEAVEMAAASDCED